MKNLLKVSCLVVALLATVAMVGCGGGGGGGGGNPAAPVNTTSNEALAAKAAVTPVLQNADTILGIKVNASSRASTSDIQEFSVTSTNNAIMSAFEAPQLLRAVIDAAGGNIDSGLWVGQNNTSWISYIEVVSYSNKVYERTIYYPPEQNSENVDGTPEIAAHYVIDGCNAVLENKILKSLTINPNAKITVERFKKGSLGKKYNTLIKGTIDSDLSVKWVGEEKNYRESELVINPWDGQEISVNAPNYDYGFIVSKKVISTTTYTISKPVKLKLTKFYNSGHSFNGYRWNENGYDYDQTLKEYDSENIEVTISGITGSVIEKKVCYDGEYNHNYSWNPNNYLVFKEKTDTNNLVFSSPVKVVLAGSITNNEANQTTSYSWESGQENISNPTHVVTRNAAIKNVTVLLNKISGKIDTIVVDDAEAHVEIDSYNQDKALMIGNYEVVFNKAKVDVTGLKYNYEWEPKSEKSTPIIDPDYGYWMGMEDNEEYKKEKETMHRNCFGNAIVHLEAEETKNSVTIKANCEINKKTATLNLVNNVNLIVEDNNNGNILAFNFKTIDINATNADVLANNKCEGAKLIVKGVEKDGTKSERTYNVVNGKLVLDTKSQKDKQVPESLPTVDIKVPTEIADSNSVEVAVSEANPSEEVKTSDANATLKVGKKGDLKVASYEKKATKTDKKLSSKISAKDKIIAAVSFYGDNEYTLVFVIDYSDEKHPQIKGSIFKGKVNNKTMDSPDRIAQFAGKDGKITVIGPNGTSEVAVQ